MPSLIPREGVFTNDFLVILLKRTILNPTLTLPVYLALQYTSHGRALLATPAATRWFSHLRAALVLGLVGRVNRILSDRAANNWVSDSFVPQNEIVIVTGGSSGIGMAIVKELTKPGRGIRAVVVLDVQPLLYTAASNVSFYKVDLSSASSIAEVAEKVRTEVGAPTVLINNAGVCRGKTLLASTPQDTELTFAVNTTAHYHLAREFLPAMVAANHGHIITVASMGAYVAAPQMVDYNASKAAAQSFHEGLSVELKYTYGAPKVRTTLVSQGHVNTPLFQGFKKGGFLTPSLEPETVAEAVVEAVVKQRAAHILLPRAHMLFTGTRGLPLWLQNVVRGKVKDVMVKWDGKQVL